MHICCRIFTKKIYMLQNKAQSVWNLLSIYINVVIKIRTHTLACLETRVYLIYSLNLHFIKSQLRYCILTILVPFEVIFD